MKAKFTPIQNTDSSSKTNLENVSAQNPIDFTHLRLSAPKQTAAGLKAVGSALKHVFSQMNLSKGIRTLFLLNQKNGFDCPGCAWPDPDGKRSALGEYCENGAKAIAEEATDKTITKAFFEQYSTAELSQKTDYWLSQQGRLTEPMVLRKGKKYYEPIAWEEAFQMIAQHLKELEHPDEAIFYTSGRTSNEAAFLYQLFVRKFGTNNLPDCSNMCHESSGTALSETLGIGKGSVTLNDFEKTELIIVIGQNPGTNHPRMLTALQKAKEKGAKIITINPLPETGLIRFKNPQNLAHLISGGVDLTDVFLQVKINGDVALLKAIMLLLLEKEKEIGNVLDKSFIFEHTTHFEEFQQHLCKFELGKLVQASGVSLSNIQKAVELIANRSKIIVCWAMGLTQHKNAVANIQEIVNLLLLKGSIGKEGAGTCPVRGHSNVQGDRTMGIWERPKPEFLDKLQEVFGFQPPRKHGLDTVAAIEAMQKGEAKVFLAMGGNFLSATPDTELTAQALQQCRLTAHVSTKLNRSHLVTGENALILPCLGRTEADIQKAGKQFVSVENSMGVVHKSQGHLTPISTQLFSEPAIIAHIAHQTLGSSPQTDWLGWIENYDHIRDKIAQVIPGFEQYNEKVRKDGGFYLPNASREGRFHTPDKKAHFTLHPLPEIHLEKGQFLMMTIRSHDQFNTTIYGLNDRYRGIYQERRVVLMNEEDMKEGKFHTKTVVHLISEYNGKKRKAENFYVIPYPIPRQCVATYFPEANVLVPLENKADKSNTPASKSVIIRLEKATIST